MKEPKLMKFDPIDGTPEPFPSEANQYRRWHGAAAWLFNPYTGSQRDARDVGTDVMGHLIFDDAATPEQPETYLTAKESWWAGARAGLGLEANTPRAEVAKRLPNKANAEINKELLNKLLPWKLKIMPDEDGGTKWVHAVVRIGINPYVPLHSIEVNYAGDPKYIKAGSMEEAANMCMQDLIEKLEAMKNASAAESTCQVRNEDTGVTETMTRDKAKLLQAELRETHIFGVDTTFSETYLALEFTDPAPSIYTYTLKANLVKLDGELMTREAAIAKWESKKDTHDRYYFNYEFGTSGMVLQSDNYWDKDYVYELRAKPLKQVSWKDVPVGVAVTHKGVVGFYIGSCIDRNGEFSREVLFLDGQGYGKDVHTFDDTEVLELAPASEQPWIAVQEGVNGEELVADLRRKGFAVECYVYGSKYRITGLAEGWVLK